ncbi:MAG: glycosyltransferase, partial [Gemmatimonadetes bacterium]|nr:glycosyltransferase [Gemmatimonadota bacterium]NIR77720.1 glycosyltransferase [Gemmatimonadota bacterium]NIT86264.1 glycosyltransferase [Gemmatimonadota bacterium]NIU30090.1 glycosyltransferase [Gemmatimonadota bacterium]NIU35038.1 glycosyltransferase [Gemmatimonadota bacterium]
RCGNPARLRNVGVGEARGRFVAFLDSDDLWEPDKLEVQRSRLEGSREFGWSYTDVSLIDERGRELPKENFEPWSPRSGRIFDDLLVHDAMIALPSVMARRSLVMDVGGFDQALDFCEDYEMWLRLARRSPVLAIDERLTRVRLHTNSHTHARAEVNRDFAEIYERMLSSHPDDATRSACRRQVAYYRAWFAVGLLRRGRYGRALGELSRAARRSPFHGEAWLVFLKQTIRALVRGSWASRA